MYPQPGILIIIFICASVIFCKGPKTLWKHPLWISLQLHSSPSPKITSTWPCCDVSALIGPHV